MPVAEDDDVVDAEIVAYESCEHVFPKSGEKCTHKPVDGYPLCQTHLSKASITEIALVRSRDVDVTFEKIRGRRVTNPLEELADLISEVLLYKDFSAAQVAELRGQMRYEGKAGEQLRAEVALYERSLDRAGKLLVEWSRLNIDDRLAKIEERKAQMVIDIFRGALSAANVTDDDRRSAEVYIIKALRAAAK